MNAYIQTKDGLKKLSGGGSGGGGDFSGYYNDLKGKPEILDDGSEVFYIADSNGYVIAKIDATGLHTVGVKINDTDVETAIRNAVDSISNVNSAVNEHKNDTTTHVTEADRSKWNNKSNFSGSYNDLRDLPNVLDDESDSFNVVDKDGNIIATIDEGGVHTVDVYLGSNSLLKLLDDVRAGIPAIDETSIVATADGKLALNSDYIAYLEGVTYKSPTIYSFELVYDQNASIPSSNICLVGTTINFGYFNHTETNVGNIAGNLTLYKNSTSIKTNVAPASTLNKQVTLSTDQRSSASHKFTSEETITYKLEGTNTHGVKFSKTISYSSYYESLIGASTLESLDGFTVGMLDGLIVTTKRGIAGTYVVNVTEPSYIYFCCQEGYSVNKVTSAGFDVAMAAPTMMELEVHMDHTTGESTWANYKIYRTADKISVGEYELIVT